MNHELESPYLQVGEYVKAPTYLKQSLLLGCLQFSTTTNFVELSPSLGVALVNFRPIHYIPPSF